MIRSISVFVFCLCLITPFFLKAEMTEDEKISLNKADFYKAVVNSDAIFIATYLQGGNTKAKVKLVRSIVGSVGDEEIITDLESEKIRKKFKLAPFKPGSQYVFFVKKEGGKLSMNPDGISIPVISNKVNFSFNSPYSYNFWQIYDADLFDTAIKAIREKEGGTPAQANQEKLQEFFKNYIKSKELNSLKELLAIAQYLQVKLDEENYLKLIAGNDSIGCLAVLFSNKIMGDIFFKKSILPKIKEFNQDLQIAIVKAAVDADAKEIVPILGGLLQSSESYAPASSECFPVEQPVTNKETFIRAIIEISTPDTNKIIEKELKTDDAQWLSTILHVLSEYEGEDLVTLVVKAAVNERSSEKKIEYGNYFERINTPDTAKILMGMFGKSEELFWKKIILSTLGKYRYPEVLPFIVKALEESPSEEVRSAAAIAIGQLNNKDGVKPLFNFVMREKSVLAKTLAIDAMAEIADQSVQEYLKKIITKEDNSKVREEAANAIEDNLFILRYGKKKNQ